MSKITLYDGSRIECYPAAQLSKPMVEDTLSLDTTGEYLQIGKKSQIHPANDECIDGKQREQQLFYEHVHLFLTNADLILSDSRLFLTPVNIPNGMAYTGGSGLRHATLGVYIEWWLYYKEASIDANGRPIWFISGSPLSGRSACSVVDRKGRIHPARLNGRFWDVWTTFMEVNERYADAKSQYLAYDLREVVDLLEGHTDNQKLLLLHLRLEKVKYENHIETLKKALAQAREISLEYKSLIQQLLVEQNREAAEEYYKKCINLQTKAKLSRELFLVKRQALRNQLRNGTIDNRSYQQQLTPLRKQTEEDEYEYRSYETSGLIDVFGYNGRLLTLAAVGSILTSRKN